MCRVGMAMDASSLDLKDPTLVFLQDSSTLRGTKAQESTSPKQRKQSPQGKSRVRSDPSQDIYGLLDIWYNSTAPLEGCKCQGNILEASHYQHQDSIGQ